MLKRKRRNIVNWSLRIVVSIYATEYFIGFIDSPISEYLLCYYAGIVRDIRNT